MSAAPVEVPVDGSATAVEAAVNSVPTRIEPLGRHLVTCGVRPVGSTIETSVSTIATPVQVILDPITPLVEALLDTVAASICPFGGARPDLRAAHE